MRFVTKGSSLSRRKHRRLQSSVFATDGDLLQRAKVFGIGLFPAFHLRRSAVAKNRMSLYLDEQFKLPSQFPVALIPTKCAYSTQTVLDIDKTFLVPSASDLSTILGSEHVELIDVVSVALFIAIHLALDPHQRPLSMRWFELQLNAILLDASTCQDEGALCEALNDIYEKLSKSIAVPPRAQFLRAARYVVGRMLLVESSEKPVISDEAGQKAHDAGGAEYEAAVKGPATAALFPVLDCLVNKWSARPNVEIKQIDAKTAKDELFRSKDEEQFFPLRGARQMLKRAAPSDEYILVLTSHEVCGGEELTMVQDFPEGIPRNWSPLDRLRFGAT